MAMQNQEIIQQLGRRYDAGFVTDIESDTLPPGLDEGVVRFISAKKEEPEWLTEWRLKAYRHWLTMVPPEWAKLEIAPIDFQAVSYYAAPKAKYATLADVPQELLDTYEKLGVPLHERSRLAGVAVDAVFDSVSVATTFKEKLGSARFHGLWRREPRDAAVKEAVADMVNLAVLASAHTCIVCGAPAPVAAPNVPLCADHEALRPRRLWEAAAATTQHPGT